jgi:hypothetical protein
VSVFAARAGGVSLGAIIKSFSIRSRLGLSMKREELRLRATSGARLAQQCVTRNALPVRLLVNLMQLQSDFAQAQSAQLWYILLLEKTLSK